jgi:hypothetical protein
MDRKLFKFLYNNNEVKNGRHVAAVFVAPPAFGTVPCSGHLAIGPFMTFHL